MGLFTRSKEVEAYNQALKDASGYYYYQYSHDYTNLTNQEIDDFPNFCKLQLAEYSHINNDFIHLEEKETNYVQDGQRVIYYAKIGSRIIGRLNIEVYMVTDELFKANVTFLNHQVIPIHQKAPKLKPIKKFKDLGSPNLKHKYHTKQKKVD